MRSNQIPSFRSFDWPFTYTSAGGVEGRCYLNGLRAPGQLAHRPTS